MKLVDCGRDWLDHVQPAPKEQPPRKLSGKRTSKVPSELWREAFFERSPKG